jgi:hypothetical protein
VSHGKAAPLLVAYGSALLSTSGKNIEEDSGILYLSRRTVDELRSRGLAQEIGDVIAPTNSARTEYGGARVDV